MSVPRYDSYRDSGVEWLGEVPSHWPPTRLRYVAKTNPSKTELSGADRSQEVSFLPMDAIGEDGSLRLTETRAISEVETGYTYFRDGDVVVAKITPCFENGKGAIMRGLQGGVGFGTTELIVARPKGQNSATFLHWLFCSPLFRLRGEASMYGAGGQKRVPDDFVRDFLIGLPPPSEQTAIAAFLDRETAKIDALVEEQRRLIALLAEKRQAVISHAVTKGLDPTVPMKDSGVEGLGEVPAHWEVKRLKHLGCFSAGAGFPDREQGLEGEALSFHKVNALGKAGPDGYLLPSENTISIETALRLRAFVFPPDAIVFAKIGAALLLGRLRMLRVPACLDNNMMGFVVQSPNKFRYIRYLMSQIRFDLIANPGAVPSLNESQIANLAFAIPCSVEQEKITIYLDNEIFRSDALTAEAQAAITLLQERRAALISAAVTGKIDVRGLGPAVEEAA